MSSEVAEMITALREGSMSLDEVASKFRARTWPRRRKEMPRSYLELAAAAQQDPEPFLPGSFDEVLAAYDRGELTREQYRVLAEAVAEAKRAEDAEGESGEEGAGVG